MKTAVFISECEEIAEFLRLPPAEEGEERVVIACNAYVEFALEEKGISFISARDLRPTPTGDRLACAESWGRSLLVNELLSFFRYQGIDLGALYSVALQFYLAVFLHALDIAAATLQVGVFGRAVAFLPPAGATPAGGILASFSASRMSDAVGLVCASRGIEFVVKGVPSKQGTARMFGLKRALFGMGLAFLNFLTAMTVRRRKIRILASENWKNVGPLMESSAESELILLDRTEALIVPWSSIRKHRMRFMHPGSLPASVSRAVHEEAEAFLRAFDTVADTPSIYEGVSFAGILLQPHMRHILRHIIAKGSVGAVSLIEGTRTLMERLKPNVVLVRAGASAQIHFAILCHVARSLGIPSLEMQHGQLHFSRTSFAKYPAAEYVAEYGPIVRRDMKTIGYTDKKLFDVGSPRFDVYKKEVARTRAVKKEGFHILCVSPRVTDGFLTDSYDVLHFFEQSAKAVRSTPGGSVTVKLRAAREHHSFYLQAIERAFAGIPHTVVRDVPLASLFASADAVISGSSTVLLEGLLSGTPTVYFSGGLQIFEELVQMPELKAAIGAGALGYASSPEELTQVLLKQEHTPSERRAMVERAHRFVDEQYSFDGKSAVRLASIVENLAARVS